MPRAVKSPVPATPEECIDWLRSMATSHQKYAKNRFIPKGDVAGSAKMAERYTACADTLAAYASYRGNEDGIPGLWGPKQRHCLARVP